MGRDALHLAKTMAERMGLSSSFLVTAAVERGLPEVIHDLARLRGDYGARIVSDGKYVR
jgi:hypothetical protein